MPFPELDTSLVECANHPTISWTRNSTFKTIEHDLHRERRSQLSPFFSKAAVKKLEPLIISKVDILCSRLERTSATQSIVCLTHAHAALTIDVISRVCFGFSYDFLHHDDFSGSWYDGMSAQSRNAHLVRQFPWIYRVIERIPWPVFKETQEGMVASKERQNSLAQYVAQVFDNHSRGEKPPNDAFTIFHSMLDADVPPREKSAPRLTEEAQGLIGAGGMTTAGALDSIMYYLLASPAHLHRLRQELDVAITDPAAIPSAAELEKLPFLAAVVHEGLRLSKGVPHRFARSSPDVSYSYGDVVIPRGVPVGMSLIDLLENPDVFPDPYAFVPERWLPLDSPVVRQRRKSLVVFGGGTRMCLGVNMAWTELYLTVAALVRRFGSRLRLYDVDFDRDIKITVDGFNALPSRESRGLRVVVAQDCEA
jgi:cytochrome P450